MSLVVGEFALNYLSWALLCLGLPRYYRQHFGMLPTARRARLLRVGGWLLAGAALAWGIDQWGWDIGAVTWALVWMSAAIGWALLQAYGARLARALAPTLLVLAVLSQWAR